MPNQDAIHWLPESGAGPPLVLAVADGHGSAKYSRSNVGANLAVETTAQLLFEFIDGQTDLGNLSLIKRGAEDWLPGALVRSWLAAVSEHIDANPFSEVELDVLGSSSGDLAASLDGKLSIAYGTTILAVAVTESFVLYVQLGDGEILTVTRRGEVSRPLRKDDRLFANETTSLCAPEAWRDFRVSFQPSPQLEPALILLSTDGYPNSFRDEAGFLKVGSDILEIIETEGLEKVHHNLESWLKDSTTAGSGDDVTLGILCSARSNHPSPNHPSQPESS